MCDEFRGFYLFDGTRNQLKKRKMKNTLNEVFFSTFKVNKI